MCGQQSPPKILTGSELNNLAKKWEKKEFNKMTDYIECQWEWNKNISICFPFW